MKHYRNITRWAFALAMTLITPQAMAETNGTLPSQQGKKPSLEDLIPGGETYRYAQNLYGLQWWGDTAILPDADEVKAINPKDGKETVIATRKEVNQILKDAGLKTLPSFYHISTPWPGNEWMLLRRPGQLAIYDWTEKRITTHLTYTPKAENTDYNTTSGHLAYTEANNLFVMTRDGELQRVTQEPLGIVCGQTVHRNEFGISKGTFWNNDGTLLAFYRMNESMVTPYPLVDVTARIGVNEPIRYPMAGMLSHEVKVGIYNPLDQSTLYLNTGDPKNRYFTNITWAPDGRSLFLIEVNRDQNHSQLCQYDAATGELVQVLIEEMHPKYVEPQTPILFLPWNDRQFIYQSQYSGYNHLYLISLGDKVTREQGDKGNRREAGEEPDACFTLDEPQLGIQPGVAHFEQLTRGEWLVQDVIGFDSRRKEIYFNATKESPLNSNLYKISLNRSRRAKDAYGRYIRQYPLTALDNRQGIHRAKLSASGDYLIDNYQTPDTPQRIDLVPTNGKERINLLNAPRPHDGLELPQIQTGTLKAADGVTDLYYRLCLPADFDPQKQYPVIVYVYGGPHAQMVNNSYLYGARGWDLYMPSKGCIMFSLDNRGSSNRGLEFENCTFRRLGIEEGKDQMKGVEYLKSLPYVDQKRIGVHGWSFGGHMTTALMLRYPETFKTGVAGGPVIDWSYYEVMYGERYMDTPQSNPEGYKETDLKQLAGNLKGHLLIIHDDHDDTCVPQHTLSFMKACVDARTYPDLFIYPGHKHNVLGRDRVHLHEKITRYFEDYLFR